MKILGIAAGIVGVVALLAYPVVKHGFSMETFTMEITGKEAKPKSGGGSEYRIQTRSVTDKNDIRVFKNVDSLLHWKFNSADVQARLVVGDVCTFTAYGWRVRPLSMFENINNVIECK
jgi:hypothetical protein